MNIIYSSKINTEVSTAFYPEDVRYLFEQEAAVLFHEMTQQELIVSITGKKGDHNRSRVKDSSNPVWYSELWAKYGRLHNRKTRFRFSLIKRCRVMASLVRIARGEDSTQTRQRYICYDTELREIIFERLTTEFYIEEECLRIPKRLIINDDKIDHDLKPF